MSSAKNYETSGFRVMAALSIPALLMSVSDELEASSIVSSLADHGIKAKMVGEFTSGFRAEAPGDVKIFVPHVDLQRSKNLLSEIEESTAEIDWTKIDCQDNSPLQSKLDHPQTAEPCQQRNATTHEDSRRFQISLSTLLGLQTCLCVALVAWKGVTPALVLGFVFFGGSLMLIAAGTVALASDLSRTRQAWKYVGQTLVVTLIVVAALHLANLG